MTNGLALLGDAIAGGARDYMNITLADRRNAELRAQQLADEGRRRQDMLTDDTRNRDRALADDTRNRDRTLLDRTAAEDAAREVRAEGREEEQKQYDARRFDHMKDALVKGGYLDMKDVGNPSAVTAALKEFESTEGKQVTRDLQELAAYKSSAMELAKLGGNIPGLDRINSMDVGDIVEARAIMGSAMKKIGEVSQLKQTRNDDNAKNAALVIAHFATKRALLDGQITVMEKTLEAAANPAEFALSPEQEQAVTNAALRDRPELAKAKPGTQAWSELTAAKQKAKETLVGNLAYQTNGLYKNLVANKRLLELEAGKIPAFVSAGVYAYGTGLDSTAKDGDAPAAPPQNPATPPPSPGVYNPAGAKKVTSASGTANPADYTPKPTSAGSVMAVTSTPAAAENPPALVSMPEPAPVVAAPVSSAKWYSRDRDNAANNEAVKAAIANIPGKVYQTAVGAAQRVNPMNFVPGYEAGVDSAFVFDPEKAARLREHNRPRTLPDFDASGNFVDAPVQQALPPVPTARTEPNPREIAAENEVLMNAPFSLRAIEIRRQRGLPQPSAIEAGAMGGH